MKVSIIISTVNRYDNIFKTLQCISKQVIQPQHSTELIVIDDGSIDGTYTNLENCQDILIRRKPHDEWNASIPRNLGARVSKGELLLFVDSDILFPPDRVQRFIDDYLQDPDPNRVIIGPYHFMRSKLNVNDNDWYTKEIGNYNQDVRWKSFEEHPVSEKNSGWEYALACFGGSLLIPRNLFFKAGGYDENCIAGVEDGDFGLTLWETGTVFSLDKSLLGWHNPHPILPERTRRLKEMVDYINNKHHMDLVYQSGEAYRKWGLEWSVPEEWKK